MQILEKMRELATTDHNTYLEEAKNNGKKIIGYFCSYFPEEIVHAAGFIPYRMRQWAAPVRPREIFTIHP